MNQCSKRQRSTIYAHSSKLVSAPPWHDDPVEKERQYGQHTMLHTRERYSKSERKKNMKSIKYTQGAQMMKRSVSAEGPQLRKEVKRDKESQASTRTDDSD